MEPLCCGSRCVVIMGTQRPPDRHARDGKRCFGEQPGSNRRADHILRLAWGRGEGESSLVLAHEWLTSAFGVCVRAGTSNSKTC